ncbi:hypothetical protein K438DRAFT_1946493 [Mycena galopus ATCC 62051]|nr:hypothetical protein K438DRAFT_1946493 [Mycena galopus ATCC 62051]
MASFHCAQLNDRQLNMFYMFLSVSCQHQHIVPKFPVPSPLSLRASWLGTPTPSRQRKALITLSYIKFAIGDYSASQIHSYEARRLANISANLWDEAAALQAFSPPMLKSEYMEARNLQTQILANIPIEEISTYRYAMRLLNIAEIDVAIGAPKDKGTGHWSPSSAMIFLAQCLKSKHMREIYQALKILGQMFQVESEQDTALTLLTVALEGFTQLDIHLGRADCMLHLGDISKEQGDLFKAVELWKSARPFFERASQGKQAALIEDKLGAISLEDHQSSLVILSKICAPTTALSGMTKEGAAEIDERVEDMLDGNRKKSVPVVF